MSLAQWNGPASDQPGSRIRTELQLMRRLQDQGIPYVASVWHLPEGLTDRIRHVSSYLLHAREQYGVEPGLFSFNQELLLHARPQALIYWEFTAGYSLCRVAGSGVEPTGRFWLTKHFTDLTPANARALATASDHPKVLITAFAGESSIAVHIANLSDARQATLTGLPAQIAAWRPILTTGQQGYAEQPSLEPAQGALQLTLPARSLLTLVAAPSPTAPPDSASSTPHTALSSL